MSKSFSDRYILNLKPREKEYRVREGRGFTLRVFPSGVKTFLFIYEVAGKRKQVNLGNYPALTLTEARAKFVELSRQFARGEEVVVPLTLPPEPEVTVMTVETLVTKYLKDSLKDNVQSWSSIKKGVLENKIKHWYSRTVESITKEDALNLVDRERDVGDGAMRNVNRIVGALFQYAEDRDLITKNPFRGLKKIKPALRNVERKRFLTTEEIVKVWEGITTGGGSDAVKRALKMILVTAQRPGEVTGMHRREIMEDAEGKWVWTIPAARAEKGKRDHRVFLTSMALELIGEAKGFIFPTPRRTVNAPMTKVSLSQRVQQSNCYGVPHWTPHDLRRTARTHFSRLRVPKEHAEAVLNHAKGGMVKVYDQYQYDDEKREALLVWESELLRLLAQASTSE